MQGGLANIHEADIRQRVSVSITERSIEETHVKAGSCIATVDLERGAGRYPRQACVIEFR